MYGRYSLVLLHTARIVQGLFSMLWPDLPTGDRLLRRPASYWATLPAGVHNNMNDEDEKTLERRSFLLLVVFLAPIVAVAVVGGYGFLVWFSQLAFFGAPGPAG